MVKFVRIHVAYVSSDSFKLFIQIIDDKIIFKKGGHR
jgi:hypothetical protein